jgi:hypothetical protein
MSNYYDEQKKAFIQLDNLFAPKSSDKEIDLNWLIISIQKSFSISEKVLNKKIEQYVKAKVITMDSETIYIKKKV